MCYVSTKSSTTAQYELEIKEDQILIISSLKQKVKQRLDLANIHAKVAPKYKRDVFYSDGSTAAGSPLLANKRNSLQTASAPATTNDKSYWYPVKLMLPHRQVRKILLKSRSAQELLISAIHSAQGFSSPLDQYEIEG